MRNNLKKRSCLLLAVLCMAGFSITAHASGGEDVTALPDDTASAETETVFLRRMKPLRTWKSHSAIPSTRMETFIVTIDGVSEAVTITATGTVVTGGSRLNLRTGAGMDYEIIDQLRPGEEVTVIGSEGDWYEVIVPEKKGFVHSDYLRLMKMAGRTSKSTLTR